MPTPRWPWWHRADGPDEFRIRELLRAIWDLHATYGLSSWLWRGQPNFEHDITPAVHTRVGPAGLDDDAVKGCTRDLIDAAKRASLDLHEGVKLPDLALLAMLQHHGAATPLLDVTFDPLVGLYMAVVSSVPEDEERDGVLFAVRRPSVTWPAYSSDKFEAVYDSLAAESVTMYSAPDVSERLRVQRGHFLIGRVAERFRTSIPLGIENPAIGLSSCWIWRFMAHRGEHGIIAPVPEIDVAVFRVFRRFKRPLRVWLEERSGLTPAFVLPTAWHRPHLDGFCASHSRSTSWRA